PAERGLLRAFRDEGAQEAPHVPGSAHAISRGGRSRTDAYGDVGRGQSGEGGLVARAVAEEDRHARADPLAKRAKRAPLIVPYRDEIVHVITELRAESACARLRLHRSQAPAERRAPARGERAVVDGDGESLLLDEGAVERRHHETKVFSDEQRRTVKSPPGRR